LIIGRFFVSSLNSFHFSPILLSRYLAVFLSVSLCLIVSNHAISTGFFGAVLYSILIAIFDLDLINMPISSTMTVGSGSSRQIVTFA